MCELISYFWKDIRYWKDDKLNNKTCEEIWNYSSTGELLMVFEWFREARVHYKLIPCSKCGEYNQIVDIKIDYKNYNYIYLCGNCK